MSSSNITTFWDSTYSLSPAPSIEDLSHREQDAINRCIAFFGDVYDKSILDIGCGLGQNAIALAKLGANVTAIDISEMAIKKLKLYSKSLNISINAIVSDAKEIERLGQFDFVIGSMILHHMEPFGAFCKSLSAVMKPKAKGFFYENNAASSLLVWMREKVVGKLWIPKYGDANESPLTKQEVDVLRNYFSVVQVFPELMFFSLAAPYLFNRHGEQLLAAVDKFLYKRNILVKYSYRQILLIEKK